MEPDGTRLERLQASQDRLLRYAHFRLGEELMKSHLGASNLPTAPSSPGVWDVEYDEDHAEALGLEPNSYDVFAPRGNNEPDEMSSTLDAPQSALLHAQSLLDHQPSFSQSALDGGASSTSATDVNNSQNISSSSKSVQFDGSSIISSNGGEQQHQHQHQQPHQYSMAPSMSDSQLIRGEGSAVGPYSSSSLRISASTGHLTKGGVVGVGGDGGSAATSSMLQPQQQQQQQQQHQSQQDRDAAILSRADSAMQFFMRRSQIIDPPVRTLLNQVKDVGKKKDDHVLAGILRPPPSHSYGTKKGYRSALQRQKQQRAKRRQSLKSTGKNTSAIFRSTSRLREILDSKPKRRKPRRLASLAHQIELPAEEKKREKRSGEQRVEDIGTLDEDSKRASVVGTTNNGPRVLNTHLQVPQELAMKEPIFLPLEWFDSSITTESAIPVEKWIGLRGKSRWYFSSGEWEWRDIEILEYNKESARYHIQWISRPEKEMTTTSFFVTLGVDLDHNEQEKEQQQATPTGVAAELEREETMPTTLPPPETLPSKWVSRANLWLPSKETETQHRTRMATAKRHRDAYEARARYLAHVQAMAPLVKLPPVSVPSELFQAALARAGIKMDSPEDLQKMTRQQIRSLATVTEEVRRIYVDCMDVLHTQDVVTIPLPGLPSGAAGVPPPIRYESESLKILREGGIPLWTKTCGTQDYQGIRAKLPTSSLAWVEDEEREEKREDSTEDKVASKEEEASVEEEYKEGEETAATKVAASTTHHDPSSIVEPPPSGYSTMIRNTCNGSPISLIETYLPASNPDVLKALQDVSIQILHRLRSMDWLWGLNTSAPPEFCFQRSDITPKALERAITHPWPALPERMIDETTKQSMVDDPRLLPELPTTLEVFVLSQTRQHHDAARISHAHTEKWLDNIFADGYGIAADQYVYILFLSPIYFFDCPFIIYLF